jgi:UDP-N-acetylmuramate dehydrogenase
VKKIIQKISKNLKSKFYFDYDTSKNVWFRAGGKASIFCLVYDDIELRFILDNIKGISYEIIGAGSNILVRDGGYHGIIFKLGKNFNNIVLHENFIQVGASILDINLSKFAEINNIKNFEFFSGIPGSIGGAVKMNAGCFGFETNDSLIDIKTINSEGEFCSLNKEELKLTYRNSDLPDRNIIVSANFSYSLGDKNEIKHKINQIKIMREKSQPFKSKTSGSTFKNPKNNFAAKLIEMSECKGLNVGDIFVSSKHANFLINSNQGTSSQIEELGKIIIDKVYKKFNIKLEWEIKIIGN